MGTGVPEQDRDGATGAGMLVLSPARLEDRSRWGVVWEQGARLSVEPPGFPCPHTAPCSRDDPAFVRVGCKQQFLPARAAPPASGQEGPLHLFKVISGVTEGTFPKGLRNPCPLR